MGDNAGLMWEPFLWLALAVAVWRWLRHPHGPSTRPLPNVGDAPAGAEPLIRPRLDDNGLATYSMVVPVDHAPASDVAGKDPGRRR